MPRKRCLPFLVSDLLSARALLRRAARRQYIIETEVKLTDRNTAAAFKLIANPARRDPGARLRQKKGQMPRKRRLPFLVSELLSARALLRGATRRQCIIELIQSGIERICLCAGQRGLEDCLRGHGIGRYRSDQRVRLYYGQLHRGGSERSI